MRIFMKGSDYSKLGYRRTEAFSIGDISRSASQSSRPQHRSPSSQSNNDVLMRSPTSSTQARRSQVYSNGSENSHSMINSTHLSLPAQVKLSPPRFVHNSGTDSEVFMDSISDLNKVEIDVGINSSQIGSQEKNASENHKLKDDCDREQSSCDKSSPSHVSKVEESILTLNTESQMNKEAEIRQSENDKDLIQHINNLNESENNVKEEANGHLDIKATANEMNDNYNDNGNKNQKRNVDEQIIMSAGELGENPSFNTSENGRNCSVFNSNTLVETLNQHNQDIDESLLPQNNTDDECSLNSSSVEYGFDNKNMDDNFDQTGSLLSMANTDVALSKDRLVFERVDSENSDTGIISPVSEIGRLSPVSESVVKSTTDTAYVKTSTSGLKNSSAFNYPGENSVSGDKNVLEEFNQQSGINAESKSDDPSQWSAADDDLEELSLYIQGHSDTLLILLLDRKATCSKEQIHSLVSIKIQR